MFAVQFTIANIVKMLLNKWQMLKNANNKLIDWMFNGTPAHIFVVKTVPLKQIIKEHENTKVKVGIQNLYIVKYIISVRDTYKKIVS